MHPETAHGVKQRDKTILGGHLAPVIFIGLLVTPALVFTNSDTALGSSSVQPNLNDTSPATLTHDVPTAPALWDLLPNCAIGVFESNHCDSQSALSQAMACEWMHTDD